MRAPAWLPLPVRRALRVVRRYWRVVAFRLEKYTSPVRRSWRLSLQVRVVTLTLIASSLLVGTFGWFIAWRSADILLNRAEAEVAARARRLYLARKAARRAERAARRAARANAAVV